MTEHERNLLLLLAHWVHGTVSEAAQQKIDFLAQLVSDQSEENES